MQTTGLGYELRRQRTPKAKPNPTWDVSKVLLHDVMAPDLHRLVLRAPTIAESAQAGQFVMINFPEFSDESLTLPRPMAIHRRRRVDASIEIIMKVQGEGTARLSRVRTGEELLVTGPLGTGFVMPPSTSRVLLMGRGIGICSLMTVAEECSTLDVPTTVVLSARSSSSHLGATDCIELGAKALEFNDEDGTSDVEFIADRLTQEVRSEVPDAIFTCGSKRLIGLSHALGQRWGAAVQASIESNMACGLGYCHGCVSPEVATDDGELPLVCTDGPVFDVLLQD